MKKAFQISLAGTVFTMEDDAYAKLDGYLSSIKAHFAHTEGKDEIVKDIEARIAEKLLESGKTIIAMMEVESVIASMGKVEDFGDGVKAEAPRASRPKKLYRNPDDTVVSGVCSGLGKYFGIDAIWIRVAFVLATIFLNGFPVIAYLIMWMAVPEAKTAAQKLEMEGTPVTLETLSENVKEKVEEIEVQHGTTLRRIVSFPFVVLKKIVLFIKRALFPLGKGIIGLALAIGSLAVILGLSFSGSYILSSPDRIADFPITDAIPYLVIGVAIVSAYLVLAIPAVFLFLLALGIFRSKVPVSAHFGYTLLGVWIIAIMSLGASVAVSASSFQEYEKTSPVFETVTKEIPITGNITNLAIAHRQNVRLVQGDDISLVATGREQDIERLFVEVEDGMLTIKSDAGYNFCIFCIGRNPEITLTLPDLDRISLSHGSQLESAHWNASSPISLELRYGSQIDMDLIGPETRAIVEHGSNLELTGASERADFQARHGSSIDASAFSTKNSKAVAEHGSSVRVQSTIQLEARASHGSSIRYTGNPQLIDDPSFGSEIGPLDDY